MVLIFFNFLLDQVRYVPEYKWQQDHSILVSLFIMTCIYGPTLRYLTRFIASLLYSDFSWTSLAWLTVLHCFIADEEMFSRNEQYAEPRLQLVDKHGAEKILTRLEVGGEYRSLAREL
jgi:hypothetical protein